MATKITSAIPIAGRHRVKFVRGAAVFLGHDLDGKPEMPTPRAQAATADLWRTTAGWLCAVGGWIGVATWYLQVLAGTRPSEHFLGVLCCLILTQLGRVLLQRPAPAEAQKTQKRHLAPRPHAQSQSVLNEWVVTW
jgi:hypothetical protein